MNLVRLDPKTAPSVSGSGKGRSARHATAPQRGARDRYDPAQTRRAGDGEDGLAGTARCRSGDPARRPARTSTAICCSSKSAFRQPAARCTGRECRGGEPDRPRHPAGEKRARGHQDQIDDHGEIGLNEFLERHGVAAHETDLAEMILQLGNDQPSHIVVPALHKNRQQMREIFARTMGLPRSRATIRRRSTAAARQYLREKFPRVKTAVCGANFLIAETGAITIVESEGNGRMCLTLPETLIASSVSRK